MPVVPGLLERLVLLREGRHVVGREDDCRVIMDHESISRRHAEIAVGAQGLAVRDLGSANGTFVDGERVEKSKIKAGVEVRFGEVTVRFEML